MSKSTTALEEELSGAVAEHRFGVLTILADVKEDEGGYFLRIETLEHIKLLVSLSTTNGFLLKSVLSDSPLSPKDHALVGQTFETVAALLMTISPAYVAAFHAALYAKLAAISD